MINVLSFISAVICLFCSILGVYIIRLDPKKWLHQLCFFTIISMAFLNVIGMLGFSASDKSDFVILFKIGCVGVMVIFPLMIHLTMEIVKVKNRTKFIIVIPFYLAFAFFIYHNVHLRVTYQDFIRIDGFWRFIKVDNGWINPAFNVFSLSSFAICFFLLIRWRIRSNSKREKKQAFVLLVAAFLLIACLFSEQVILRFFLDYDLGLSIIYFFVWPAGVGLAILKYRFLGIPREQIFTEVFENIDEPVIVLDGDLTVGLVNQRARDYITDKKTAVGDLVSDFDSVHDKVRELMTGSSSGFGATLRFRKKDDTIVPMAVRFSSIRDRFGDKTGVLLIARPVTGLKEFLLKYGLTEREFAVLKLLVTGIPGKEISAKLYVAESTVKTHIEHIYNKTHVGNKVELLNLLRKAGLAM